MIELLIATKNKGKIEEIEILLETLPVRLRSLNEFPQFVEPEETGATFAENARLKAAYYARQTGLRALADDSGLEVEALGGAPGVFSARYAGGGASDRDNTEKLLKQFVAGTTARRARFVCVMALSDESGEIKFTAEGVCTGEIAESPRGTNGFGYDPVFIPGGFRQTFAELSGTEKRQISHRARAAAKIISFLRDFIAV